MRLDFWNNKKRDVIKKYRVAYRGMLSMLKEHNDATKKMEFYRCQMYEKVGRQIVFSQWAKLSYDKEFERFRRTWKEYCSYRDQLWPLRCEFNS